MTQREHADFFMATEGFVLALGGETFTVKRGDLVRAGHPLLAARARSFAPTAQTRPELEAATAAPGERR